MPYSSLQRPLICPIQLAWIHFPFRCPSRPIHSPSFSLWDEHVGHYSQLFCFFPSVSAILCYVPFPNNLVDHGSKYNKSSITHLEMVINWRSYRRPIVITHLWMSCQVRLTRHSREMICCLRRYQNTRECTFMYLYVKDGERRKEKKKEKGNESCKEEGR